MCFARKIVLGGLLGAVLGVVGAVGAAQATVLTYDYTGNPLAEVDTGAAEPGITGIATFDVPAGFTSPTDTPVAALSLSLSEGGETFDDVLDTAFMNGFIFDHGQITLWTVVLVDFSTGTGISTFGGGAGPSDFAGTDSGDCAGDGCANQDDPGSWTLVPTAVPEPATLAVLGVGLVGLASFRRRKRA